MKNPRSYPARSRAVEVVIGLAAAGCIGAASIPVVVAWSDSHPAEPSPAFQRCTTVDPTNPDRDLTASCQVGSVQNPRQEATNVPSH